MGSRLRLSALRAANLLRRAGVPLRPRARVVYHPDYVATGRERTTRHAFDTLRPRRIVDQLQKAGVLAPGILMEPVPVSQDELLLVHTPEFLREIARPERLAQLLHLEPGPLGPSEPLRAFLLQTGGTLLAARRALRDGRPVVNLGGGFHHAQRDRAEGFCPVNDVAVAVRRLQQEGRVRRVLVVDLDYHHGNGTALIFSDDEDVFTLSVHGQTWAHVVGKVNNLDVELPPRADDRTYLRATRKALAYALTRFTPELAIYLAGADAFGGDALGDFALSEDGMLTRDLMVMDVLRRAGVPVAVTLAGGYGPMAWTIAYNFVFSLLTGLRIDTAYRPGNIEAAYRRLKGRIDPAELRKGAENDTDLGDPDDLLTTRRCHGHLYLAYYTCEGLQTALEHYGFLDLLRERGFTRLRFFMSADDPDRQIFRIYFDREDAEHLLVELVCRFRTLVTPLAAVREGMPESFRMLSIEWLLMQNPRDDFSLDRQKLPGQHYPGLGLGRRMLELLRMMAERLECTGLMNTPQHYHNAYLYSKQMLCFYPEDQGRLEAMKRDLRDLPPVETSIAIDRGALRDAETGERVEWEGRPQVMPVRPDLNRYFTRPSYIRAVAEAREKHRFRLDERAIQGAGGQEPD